MALMLFMPDVSHPTRATFKSGLGIIMLDPYIPDTYKSGMSTLREYLEKAKITQKDFADIIEVKQATVSRLASQAMLPSLNLALRIELATGGKVPVSEWKSQVSGSVSNTAEAAE
jgi:DNA-binding XRE family transcriptional regulator